MAKLYMVYVTASDKDEAMKIGKKLLSLRLVACVNIFDNIASFYWWEGRVQKDQEAVLIMKTRESLLTELESQVKKMHSYSCPCIVAIPVIHSSREYAEWVVRETGGKNRQKGRRE